MLRKLTIKNIALIDSAEINFTEGLNVLSGETGSGKSVILESLNFVLGAKADKSLIRSGQTECSVKAEFDVSNNNAIKEIFDEFDIEHDEALIVSRKFNIDGKSSIKVNGESITASMLKRFTSLLVDVHGQSEHFHLLKTNNQLALIDEFNSAEILPLKNRLKDLFLDYKNNIKKLEELGGDECRVLLRLDVLNYQINEIESANLRLGEEEELVSIRQKLSNQAKITEALNSVRSAFDEEGGAVDRLNYALKSIGSIIAFSNDYSDLYDRLSSVLSEIDDVSRAVDNEIDSIDFSDYDADTVEERLDLIKSLKKKYGDSIEEIQLFLDNAKNEREKLENFNQLTEDLMSRKIILEDEIFNLYNDLSLIRRKSSDVFSRNVICELEELGMTKADFCVQFNESPARELCVFESSNGFDKIEFMFSANSGQPLKPLSSVISGGEMSRFMLSVKVQAAKFNNISTYIFDEIDAGISGKTASIVAEKFAKISKDVQVIAITHLPQISAMADNNLLILKTENDSNTLTEVRTLDEETKISEIVRLVGGNMKSESAIKHAKEIINNAIEFKRSIN